MTPTLPLRTLCSEQEAPLLAPCLQTLGRDISLCHPGDPQAVQADIAFISRDITGRSTKFEIEPDTERFYAALRATQGLRRSEERRVGKEVVRTGRSRWSPCL